jgi:hypothetical protein
VGAALGPRLASAGEPAEHASARADVFCEPVRQLPVRDDADVIVCGGGPAGVAAALTAARCGAKVWLFELHGCLGGIWTAGLLTYIFDFDKPGLTRELARQLDARGARPASNSHDRFVYDPEKMKVLLEDLCTAAGVEVQLFTQVAAAYRAPTGKRLATVVTESKGGRQAWRAKVFIDCTGDGDLGALAGCHWEIGRGGPDCPCQPMTLNALIVVKDAAALKDYISFYGGDPSFRIHETAVEKLWADFRKVGLAPSYGRPTLFHIRDNLLEFMVNHEYGVKPFEPDKLSQATIRARAEVHRLADGLRKLGGPWAGLQVAATAEQIGIREGRRIRGRAVVTRDDLVAGTHHEDAVCRVTFGADIHATSPQDNAKQPITHGNIKMKPYDIPLGALIARDVDGLMMAGRCISGDFLAHASYRVTGDAVAMGEAAGAVAALAAAAKRLPHEVPWSEAAASLRRLRQPG